MKKESRKLNLRRETLITLQNDELDQINGGITPLTTITMSSNACWQASKAASKAASEAVSRAASEAARTTISLPPGTTLRPR